MVAQILADEWRLLTFRPIRSRIDLHWKAYLAFGFACTWLAGLGRYWDHPNAYTWQYLGLGSIAYVIILALIIWVFLAPLRPNNWTYLNVLLFVTLTAPPAVLYAVPVERFMNADASRMTNTLFLAVVASWRVALYSVFLARVGGLQGGARHVGTLLPLAIIVIVLSLLNLEHVVFSLMSGISEQDRGPHDGAFTVVVTLSLLSFFTAPFLAVAYFAFAFAAWRRHRAGDVHAPRGITS